MEVMNMLRSRFLFLNVVLLCTASPLLLAEDNSRWLVPRSQVASTDLKIVWQFNLPLSDSETLDRLLVAGNRLYALSSRNELTCFNRVDGNRVFSSVVAPAGLPLTGLEYYKGKLMTVVGSELVEIDAESGVNKSLVNITGGVICPAVRNDSFFYVAGSDKRLHMFKADDKVQVPEIAADNGSLITTVLAEEDFVVFGTEDGNVVSIAVGKPAKLWQFDAPGAIAGAIVRDAKSLYFACRNTNVYRLELSSGRLLWKYQIQAIPDTAPQPGKKVLYQRMPDIGLVALDKETAKPLWEVPGGMGLLSESGDKAFVVTKAGVLVVMDNVKKKQLYSVDIGQAVKYATNTADSRIYIADTKGRIACLQPAQ
jgi:outer membrane protein assembly factor BamB